MCSQAPEISLKNTFRALKSTPKVCVMKYILNNGKIIVRTAKKLKTCRKKTRKQWEKNLINGSSAIKWWKLFVLWQGPCHLHCGQCRHPFFPQGRSMWGIIKPKDKLFCWTERWWAVSWECCLAFMNEHQIIILFSCLTTINWPDKPSLIRTLSSLWELECEGRAAPGAVTCRWPRASLHTVSDV